MTCEPLRFVRSPDSILDYTIDWSGSLASGDSITESTWTSAEDDGLTVAQESLSTTSTTVWVSGGVAGAGLTTDGFYPFSAACTYYHLINTITTAGGRTDERTVVFVTKDAS